MKKDILVKSKDGELVWLSVDIDFEKVGKDQLIQWASFERSMVLQKAFRGLNRRELEKIDGLKIDAMNINHKMFERR